MTNLLHEWLCNHARMSARLCNSWQADGGAVSKKMTLRYFEAATTVRAGVCPRIKANSSLAGIAVTPTPS
jgi:hypothetical protein